MFMNLRAFLVTRQDREWVTPDRPASQVPPRAALVELRARHVDQERVALGQQFIRLPPIDRSPGFTQICRASVPLFPRFEEARPSERPADT